MPQIKSAKKRVLVTERNRLRNMAYKSAIRTAMKKFLLGVKEGAEQAQLNERLGKAFSLIDRAILKGIVHKNTGARYKSRLASKMKNTKAS